MYQWVRPEGCQRSARNEKFNDGKNAGNAYVPINAHPPSCCDGDVGFLLYLELLRCKKVREKAQSNLSLMVLLIRRKKNGTSYVVGRRLSLDVDFPVYVHDAYDAFNRYLCVWIFSSVRWVAYLLSIMRVEYTWDKEFRHAAPDS